MNLRSAYCNSWCITLAGLFLITWCRGIAQSSTITPQKQTTKKLTPQYPLTRYNEGSKYGFADQSGKIIIPCIYDAAGNFSEGLAVVAKQTPKGFQYAYIDSTGKIRINWLPYYDAFEFSNGLAPVRIYNTNTSVYKYGFINKKGTAVIPVEYDKATSFKEGIAFVTRGAQRFAIDTNGKTVFTLQNGTEYDGPDEGLIRIRANNRYGFISKNGSPVIAPQYYSAGIFNRGLCEAADSLHWGVISSKGDTVVPFLFDKIDNYSKNLITVRIRDRVGFLNKKGNMVMPMLFEEGYTNEAEYGTADKDGIGYTLHLHNGIIKATPVKKEMNMQPVPQMGTKQITDEQDGYFLPSYALFSESLAPVVKNGLVGYIDRNKKLVIPFQYTYAQSFSGGLAAVSDGKKWGFINQDNKLVIPMVYDKVLRFQSDITGVWKGSNYFTIKKSGELYQ